MTQAEPETHAETPTAPAVGEVQAISPEVQPAGAPGADAAGSDGAGGGSTVDEPAKVLRIGSMVKQLLEEVKAAPLDDASRHRLRDVYETSVRELAKGISPDLQAELDRLVSPFSGDIPSDAELRIAHAQLVGWLEGLFHGIQATMFAQQAMARQQVEQGRRAIAGPQGGDGTGTYL